MGPQERAIHLAQYLWIEPPETTVVCESPLCKNFATFVSPESEYLCVYERKVLDELTKKRKRRIRDNWYKKRRLIKEKVQTLRSTRQIYYNEVLQLMDKHRDDSLDLLYFTEKDRGLP